MRCELCQERAPQTQSKCPTCGALWDEELHRRLFGARYVLAQLSQWEREGRVAPDTIAALREEYTRRRDELILALTPASVGVRELPAEPKPAVEFVEPIRVEMPAEPKPVRPIAKVAPAPPQRFAWQDLFTERNIRWILNLGILIFSAALVVFVHGQWTGMTPLGRTSIIFGATLVAMVLGHFLRKTLLRETGTALVALGAIALPIDFLGAVQFNLIPASNGVGLVASLVCLALYAFGTRLYRAPLFGWLASAAAAAVGAFALATAGLAWKHVPAGSTPLLVLLVPLSRFLPELFRVPARWTGTVLAYSAALLALSFRTVGMTSDLLLSEVALGATVLLAVFLKSPAATSVAALSVVGMLGLLLGDLGVTLRQSAPMCASLGAVYLLAWRGVLSERFRFHAIPFVMLAVCLATCGAGLALFCRDWKQMSVVFGSFGVSCLVLGFWMRKESFAAAAFLSFGSALAFGANGWGVRPYLQPAVYAAYAAILAFVTVRRYRQVGAIVSLLAGGAAMFLVALFCLEYYRKEFGLGVAATAASALAFAVVAQRLQNRLVADLVYGSFGFAFVYALRWIGLPPQWLSVAVAAFAVAFLALHRRLKLLQPTLFTGTAASIGCTALAFVQWLVAREYAPAAATLAIVSIFGLFVAAKTPYRWAAHFGLYLGAATILCACDWLKLDYAHRLVAVFPVAVAALVVAHRRGELHLGSAGGTVLVAVLAFTYLNPDMYAKPNLPYAVGLSLGLSAIAAYATFVKPERIDLRVTSGTMGLAASIAYLLFLKWMSRGSPWGGLVVLAMAFALAGAAWLLRREPKRALPLLWVGFPIVALAAVLGHGKGTWAAPAYLGVYALALGLHAAVARAFRRIEFEWSTSVLSVALGLSLLHYLNRYTPWAGAIVFAMVPVCLLFRRPAADVPSVVLTLASALVAWRHAPICTAIFFAAFALYAGAALWRKNVVGIYLATVLAALAEFRFLLETNSHAGLLLLPAVAVFLAMALAIRRRVNSLPFLVLSVGTALVATVVGIGDSLDRIGLLLADTSLFALIAVVYRRPAFLYFASISLVALDVAVLNRVGVAPTVTAVQLLALALAQLAAVRISGERFRAYATPMMVTSLVVAVGVLIFGAWNHRRYIGPEIDWAIWGMLLAGLVHGVAGRVRRLSFLLVVAVAHLLGAYYLTLVKYHLTTLELYTLPIAVALIAGSAFTQRIERRVLELLGAAGAFLPSAVSSFLPTSRFHMIAAFALSILLVLVGMVLRRKALALAGTGCFVGEVFGKLAEFLIRADLALGPWGMIIGSFLILVFAILESRKLKFVREGVEGIKAKAQRQLAGWE